MPYISHFAWQFVTRSVGNAGQIVYKLLFLDAALAQRFVKARLRCPNAFLCMGSLAEPCEAARADVLGDRIPTRGYSRPRQS